MGETLLKTEIKRDNKYLYYCGTDKKTGNIIVCRVEMKRGGTNTKNKK